MKDYKNKFTPGFGRRILDELRYLRQVQESLVGDAFVSADDLTRTAALIAEVERACGEQPADIAAREQLWRRWSAPAPWTRAAYARAAAWARGVSDDGPTADDIRRMCRRKKKEVKA
jgi:hypothetical protein